MLYLAVLRSGHVYLPLNNAYQAGEVEYFIGNAEPGVVVCSSKNLGWMSGIAEAAGTKQVYTLDDDGTGSLLDAAAVQPSTHEPAERDSDDLAAILYTSGTTGRSKGAMLSHANLLSNAVTLKSYWGWREGDVLIHALPIFHVHGLFVASHGALLNGSRMIWFAKFDPKAVIARLPEATVFMGVPTLYVRLLAEPGLTREACRNMRLFIAGSAPLLPETFNEFRERTGHAILERYGMSETAMLTSNPYDPADGERLAGTVGFPLPGVRLRVMDHRDGPEGRFCAEDEIGDIEVAGPNVFAGYWRMPEKTKEEFAVDAEGTRWFRTGDVGRIGADGYVTIVGRSKDLIISGGYNVYPAEVEGYINELPDVAESAVVGVPHADFGEAVVAHRGAQARPHGRRRRRRRRAEGAHRRLQGAQAGVRRRRAAAQHHGQGAEEGAARRASRLVRGLTAEAQPGWRAGDTMGWLRRRGHRTARRPSTPRPAAAGRRHSSVNASAATSVGSSAAASRPSGCTASSSKCRRRIDSPAGLGALAITVRPPPVTAPATSAYLKASDSALDQRAEVGQRGVVGDRGQRRGAAEHGAGAPCCSSIGCSHQRCRPPSTTSPARKKATSSALADDERVLVALVGLREAEEQQEQAHEDGRMVREQHHADEQRDVHRRPATGGTAVSSSPLVRARLELRQLAAEQQRRAERVDDHGERRLPAEGRQHEGAVPLPGRRPPSAPAARRTASACRRSRC